MKKIFTILVTALVVIINAEAQTITGRFDLGSKPYTESISMPKEFAYDNTPLMFLCDRAEGDNLFVYDDNLDLKKTLHLIGDKTFDYQLTYQDMTREVLSVDEIGKESFCEYGSYEEFLRYTMNTEPSFDESQLIIVKQENGDSIITFDYSCSHLNTNEQMYFAYDYFGMKYPKVYFVCSNGILTGYRAYYKVAYSEWKTVGTHEENHQMALSILRLCNINLNQGDGKNDYFFEVSQTLFNEDEKFEYLIPKYKLSPKGNVLGDNDVVIDPSNPETIITTQTSIVSEDKYLTLAGFQVVSENGDVIKDLNFDNDFISYIDDSYAYVITIGNNTYLAFNGSSDGKDATIFYKIDKGSTDIRQVMKTPASMRLFPSVTDRNTPINVNFGDDNKSGSEIVVVSANGTRVMKQTVSAGQTSTQILVPSNTGIYCVSRIQNNKVTDTRKIVIK